jgi:hypothetical protein
MPSAARLRPHATDPPRSPYGPPAQARYLKFCQDYNSNACCIPGHDLENQVQFENLIDGLGPGCKNPMMYPEIRYFYCLGCDPEQPDFTDDAAQEIRVCKSFTDRLWKDPTLNECGVMRSNPCPASWGDHDMDPFMCGDDLVIPENEYNNVTNMINALKPPGLDDYTFVITDNEDDCWKPPAYQMSGASRIGSSALGITLAVATALFALVR